MEAKYPNENSAGARIFDTHAHVSSPAFDEDRDEVIERCISFRVLLSWK